MYLYELQQRSVEAASFQSNDSAGVYELAKAVDETSSSNVGPSNQEVLFRVSGDIIFWNV
jgi:hypothetical protein